MSWYRFFFPIKSLNTEEAKLYMENHPDESYLLLDVRQPVERKENKIEKSKLISLFDLSKESDNLDRTKPVLIYCRSGSRSKIAARILQAKGFETVFNINGGMIAWLS